MIDHAVIAAPKLDVLAARFESLGFTLTPRAEHPWGTANRLAQFQAGNFIELLEIDRPALIDASCAAMPGQAFDFGAHVKRALEQEPGMCMLALKGHDSAADVARWRAAGLDTYLPFDFAREARQPDGSVATVAFSLAFATHPSLPGLAFFTCHNRFPEHFWKPAFQRHANGAAGIVDIVVAAPDPAGLAPFFAGLTGTSPQVGPSELRVNWEGGGLSVLPTEAANRRYGLPAADPDAPRFRAIRLSCADGSVAGGRVEEAGGVILEWV